MNELPCFRFDRDAFDHTRSLGYGFEAFLPGPRKSGGMSESLSGLAEAGIAGGTVAIFVAILAAAGSMSDNGLTETGAYLVVGGMVTFILLMAGVGYWLSTKE